MYRLVVLSLMCFGSFVLMAQESLSYKYIDSLSYQQWDQKDWKALIKLSKQADKQGLEFYYLKLRTGIAYYERHNYIKAQRYFESILESNSKDALAQEYLYYCYLNSGNNFKKRLLEGELLISVKEKIKLKSFSFLSDVFISSGVLVSENDAIKPISDFETSQENQVQRTVLVDQQYATAHISLYPTSKTQVDLGYTYLQNQQINQIKAEDLEETSRILNQNQIYLSVNKYLKKGLRLFISGHYINYRSNYLRLNVETFREDLSSYRSYDTIVKTPMGNDVTHHVEEYDTIYGVNRERLIKENNKLSESNFLFNVGIQKRIGKFDLSLESTLGTINADKYVNTQFTSLYYPFGNLDTYSKTDISWHRNENEYGNKDNNLVFSQKIGQKLFKRLWLEGSCEIGNMRNMVFHHAALLYNRPFTTKSIITLGLILPFKKCSIYINYQLSNNEGSYSTYSYTDGPIVPYMGETTREVYNTNGDLQRIHQFSSPRELSYQSFQETINTYTFINHQITAGIKWKF